MITIIFKFSSIWKFGYLINLSSFFPWLLHLKIKQNSTKLKGFPDSQGQGEEKIVYVSGSSGIFFSGIQVGEQRVAVEKGRWANPWGDRKEGRKILPWETCVSSLSSDHSPWHCWIIRGLCSSLCPCTNSLGNRGKLLYLDELHILLCKISDGQLPNSEDRTTVQAPSPWQTSCAWPWVSHWTSSELKFSSKMETLTPTPPYRSMW